MSLEKFLFIAFSTIVVVLILYISTRRRIAFKRSLEMVFLRVIIARKDSDLDEKQDTVKDFREQISLMEQLLASLKSLYAHTVTGWLFGQDYI